MGVSEGVFEVITKFILFTIALFDFMGFTIAATVFPDLLINVNSGMLPLIWNHADRLMAVGILLGLYPVGQFLSASLLGNWSDVLGRKKILAVTLLGTLCSSSLIVLSILFHFYILLFIARLSSGIFAGNVSVAQASMIDISSEKDKAANISLIQLSLGLAWVFGAPLGSLLSNSQLISWFNYSTPFLFLTLAFLLIFIIFIFVFRETRKESKMTHLPSINPLKGIILTIQAYASKDCQRIFLIWTLFISGWALLLQFFPTFLILARGYNVHTVGPVLAFMGSLFAATQIFISRPVLKRVPTEYVLLVAMLFPGLAGLIMGFFKTGLYLGAFLFPFSMGFVLPAFLATITKYGTIQQQGLRMGQAFSIQALMTIVVTLSGGALLNLNPNSTTVLGGFIMCLGWILFLLFSRYKTGQITEG